MRRLIRDDGIRQGRSSRLTDGARGSDDASSVRRPIGRSEKYSWLLRRMEQLLSCYDAMDGYSVDELRLALQVQGPQRGRVSSQSIYTLPRPVAIQPAMRLHGCQWFLFFL
jgi:hypothetical protein